jgi:hypothetical protein
VALLAAALLLWPFSGLSWIPWLIGLGALIVLRILRLDGPLRGWDLPLAGLAVVIGLMMSTGPWAWALAASIGVLLAGLAQLPWWRLAAVGAVLCVISGAGYGISSMRSAEFERQIQAHAGDQLRAAMGVARAELVLPTMLTAVESEDEQSICRMLTPQAEAQLLAATATPDCTAAVSEMHRKSAGALDVDADLLPRPTTAPGGWTVDGCTTPWAVAAGPQLGRVSIEQTDPSVQRFAVTGFAPC